MIRRAGRGWRLVLVSVCALLALALGMPGGARAAPPALPSSFWGNVTLADGRDAPLGAVVRALVDGQARAEALTREFEGRTVYSCTSPARRARSWAGSSATCPCRCTAPGRGAATSAPTCRRHPGQTARSRPRRPWPRPRAPAARAAPHLRLRRRSGPCPRRRPLTARRAPPQPPQQGRAAGPRRQRPDGELAGAGLAPRHAPGLVRTEGDHRCGYAGRSSWPLGCFWSRPSGRRPEHAPEPHPAGRGSARAALFLLGECGA